MRGVSRIRRNHRHASGGTASRDSRSRNVRHQPRQYTETGGPPGDRTQNPRIKRRARTVPGHAALSRLGPKHVGAQRFLCRGGSARFEGWARLRTQDEPSRVACRCDRPFPGCTHSRLADNRSARSEATSLMSLCGKAYVRMPPVHYADMRADGGTSRCPSCALTRSGRSRRGRARGRGSPRRCASSRPAFGRSTSRGS
jgi:hypothetical protein